MKKILFLIVILTSIVSSSQTIGGGSGGGSQSSLPSISTKTSSYTLTSSDSTVLFDTRASDLIATLPAASTLTGKIFSIRKNDSGYNTLTFSPALKLNGSNVTALNYARTIKVQSDGVDWLIID